MLIISPQQPASSLSSATTTIAISSATAPTIGQVLTATSSTAATWQTPTGGGGYPSIASASTIDIFGVIGSTVSISGTTTVTAITACTAEQVGSIKTLVPSNAAGFSITATANIVVDGATSGTYLMPQNANIQIIATSTTTFKITTIFASGTWTPNQGAGLTLVGAFSSSGTWTKIGSQVSVRFQVLGATSVAVTTNGAITSNLPFTNASTISIGTSMNGTSAVSHGIYIGAAGVSAYAAEAYAATNAIFCSAVYFVS